MKIRQWPIIGCVGLSLIVSGCAGPSRRPAPPVPVEPQQSDREILLDHLVGRWEAPARGGPQKIAIFDGSGSLTFTGGLESFNSVRWELDETRHELSLTFPSLSNEKLQIFQLYVGQGIKSFQPNLKQITYSFMKDTWTLNIAGWEYSKVDQAPKYEAEPEPVIH